MTSGIYVIRCKVTGKVYVGSSKNIKVRWRHHRRMLKSGTHHSIKLQRAWDKYGEDAFEFKIVEEVIDGLLTIYEQVYINHYNSPVDGYNILKVAGTVGATGAPKGEVRNPTGKNQYENPLYASSITGVRLYKEDHDKLQSWQEQKGIKGAVVEYIREAVRQRLLREPLD